ncbi:MAG: MaoC family dehydratase N-terminal domain-containing protein [Actinomycetota bacterium]|nr:MaoC family dehydratase N-terminal domain-containing protein [Actinomycetota bacterium]
MTVPEPGSSFPERTFGPLSRVDIVRYAGASGDFNPIHIDAPYARATGAPDVFAMGMLPAGYLARAASEWLGGPGGFRRFKVRFAARVWPGDLLVCTGLVTKVADGRAVVALTALRRGEGPEELNLPAEEIALTGEIEAELGSSAGAGDDGA